SHKITGLTNGSSAQDAAAFGQLPSISGLLPETGGTMSGAIAMGANKITGLANGSASTDAAAFGQIPTVVAMPSFDFPGTLIAADSDNLCPPFAITVTKISISLKT